MNKAHLTAISRKTLPKPTQWLMKQGLLVGTILDYGCGKCHSVNNQHFKADGYDPYFLPNGIPFDKTHPWFSGENQLRWNTILCNYILCVLPRAERLPVLRDIQHLLKKYGKAYISVRNDKPKQGWGKSSKGTYQGRVQKLALPLLYECSGFRTYLLTKDTKLV